MDPESILKALEFYNGTFPRDALLQAIEQKEVVTPHLLDALRFARSRAQDLPDGYFLHTWAMFLLAQFRETRAYPLVVDLLELPRDTLDELHGDSLTEDVSRILASVCGGDTSLIERLAEGPAVDEFVRDAALGALVSLVAAGRRTREETLEYFRHLFHTAQAEQDSFFWPALILRSTDLYPDVVTQEIREAFDKQDIDPFLVSLKDVEATLAQGKDHTLEELSRSGYYKWVEDTVRETEWWACFQPPAPPPRIAASSPARGAAPISAPARPWAQTRPPVHLGPKPGRNAPCPCGSGLKYKKCCLKKSTA